MAIKKKGSFATRKRLNAKYGCLYTLFKPPGHWSESACVYCGNQSQSLDHIPPLVWMDALGSKYFDERRILVVKVPACLQCNATLGDRKLFTVRDRTGYLIGRYERKYKRLMHGAVWKQEEIEELHGRLRKHVEDFGTLQLGIDRRIAILEENYALRSMRETVSD